MKLLETLTLKPISDLQHMASRMGVSCLESSKQKLVSAICRRLSSADSLREILHDLPEYEYELLRFLYARRSRPTTHVELNVYCAQENWQELLFCLQDLAAIGLILFVPSASFGRSAGYQIPDDLLDILSVIFQDPKTGLLEACPSPKTVYSFTNIWTDDIITLLGYLLKNEVRVTRSCQLNRRDLKDLPNLLRGEKASQLSVMLNDSPIDWLDGLFSYLVAREWVAESDGKADLRFETLTEMAPLLDDLTTASFEKRLPSLFHGYEPEVERLMDAILTNGEYRSQWTSIASLERRLLPPVTLFNGANEAPSSASPLRMALLSLMTLGMCDLGETEGEWSWRMRTDASSVEGAARGFLHLQPNFEIIAPSAMTVAQRLALEEIAELTAADQLLHYRITKKSVYNALCRGWSAERLLQWLNDNIAEKRQVPQNVLKSLESWGASYGRLRVEEPLLLICDTPSLAEEIIRLKDISRFILGKFSDTAIILEKSSGELVLLKLKELGYLPLTGIGNGVGVPVSDREDPAPAPEKGSNSQT